MLTRSLQPGWRSLKIALSVVAMSATAASVTAAQTASDSAEMPGGDPTSRTTSIRCEAGTMSIARGLSRPRC